MSALPRPHIGPDSGYLGLRLGAADFLALEPTRDRYELVHGVVCMSPRPTMLHQRLLSLIQFELELYIRAHPGSRYFPDVDLELDASTVYAPDLVCYRTGRLARLPARLDTPPDLIIEILSHATKAFDLTTKRDDYDRFGVGEYWAIDPTEFRARCYRRQSGPLVEVAVAGGSLASVALPGFAIDLERLRSAMEQK